MNNKAQYSTSLLCTRNFCSTASLFGLFLTSIYLFAMDNLSTTAVFLPTSWRLCALEILNTLKDKVHLNNSVPTSKKTHHITVTKFNLLMIFKKSLAIYWEQNETHKETMWATCKVNEH